ncbi:SGNH/GDSL hydrolase family protein [Methylobacterium sp. P31]
MTTDSSEPGIDAEKQRLVRHLGTFDSNIRFPAPYVAFAGRPSSQIFDHGWHYDDLGYRNDVAVGPRGTAETARVFIAGDSTMVDGVTTGDTVPGRVQMNLRQTLGNGAYVYNFGAISSCLNQAIMLITTKLIDFEPDAIVIIGGGTDTFQPWTFDPRPGNPYNMFAVEAIYDDLFSQGQHARSLTRLDQEAIQDLIFSRLRNLRLVTRWKDPAWEWEVVRKFELAVDRLGRLAKGIGVPVHFILQPMVVRKSSPTENERSFASRDFLEYLDRQYERLKVVIGDYNKKFGQRDFFQINDLSDVFLNQKDQIFTDIVHYNDIGRQMMADAIASCIRHSVQTRE